MCLEQHSLALGFELLTSVMTSTGHVGASNMCTTESVRHVRHRRAHPQ